MNRKQNRRFAFLTINALKRLGKLGGSLEAIAEFVQFGDPIPPELIDEFYGRMYAAWDAMAALRKEPEWLSVDVEDLDEPE